MASAQGLTRRTLLKASAAGGALLVSVEFALDAGKAVAAPAEAMLNAFVRVGDDDVITLVISRVEMGQGTYTSLPLLIAEELEVDPSKVRIDHAPPNDKLYARPDLGIQATGGSASVRTSWLPLRQAGAASRMMLVAAAAQAWRVDPNTCHAENGSVVHPASGRRLRYGALAARAAQQPVPAIIALKRPEAFRRIGSNQLRLDGPEKVNGKARFAIDVVVPGMRIATVAASPVPGGTVRAIDEAAALAVRGVRQVVRLNDVVAVVADHMGAARKGLGAANVQWNDGAAAAYSSEQMLAELAQASQRDGATARTQGDVLAARASGTRTLEAIYHQPLMAHAAMEPLACTVHVRPDGCELWLGTQVPVHAQAAAAAVTGLPMEKIVVHNQHLGGSFGRRLDVDFVTQAVRIAREVKGPVKVIWTREEDMQHDAYRPSHYNRLSATLDAGGRPVAWQHRVTGSSILARWAPPAYRNNVDADAVRDAAGPYEFANVLVQYVRQEPPPGLLTGWWRGIGHTQNAFPVECFLDELAHAAGADPIAYRRQLLGKHPRGQRVLDLAAEKSSWGKPLPKGKGRGIGFTLAFGSYAAQVIDVTVAASGAVTVDRVLTVVDCGLAVSPRSVVAQIEGGTVYGLSAALFGNITLKNGRVEQSNFHDFRVLMMNEMPLFDTHIVPSTQAPMGIGEVSTVVVAPALFNAVFAATGKRLRRMPLATAELKT
jgi:isoquinoline 1-oxidoreductase beta subunit